MNIGKLLMVLGMGFTFAGIIYYYFSNRFSWIGNLPGDFRFERGNVYFYFPVTSMLLFSILANVVIRLVNKI
jgi:hypothetical protein